MSDVVNYQTLYVSLANPVDPPQEPDGGNPFGDKWGDLTVTFDDPEVVVQDASGRYQFQFTNIPEGVNYPTAIDMAFRERGAKKYKPIKQQENTKPMWLSRDYSTEVTDTAGIGIIDDPSKVHDHTGKWYDVLLLMRYVDGGGQEHTTLVDPEIHNAPM